MKNESRKGAYTLENKQEAEERDDLRWGLHDDDSVNGADDLLGKKLDRSFFFFAGKKLDRSVQPVIGRSCPEYVYQFFFQQTRGIFLRDIFQRGLWMWAFF